jgi:hypothetical protein
MAETQTSKTQTSRRKKTSIKERALPERVQTYLEGTGPRPAQTLFGQLPIKRFIPQDVHSVVDYSGGLGLAAGALISDELVTQVASIALGATVVTVSALTDYRLSVAKLIPIEVHEVLDYVYGASAIAAPFALGYFKKDRIASIVHIAVGAVAILTSLFTDYRAAKGVGGIAA